MNRRTLRLISGKTLDKQCADPVTAEESCRHVAMESAGVY